MGSSLFNPGGLGSGAGGSGSGLFYMKSAVAIAINALLCIGPDGLAYPAETIDYAAKPNLGDYAVPATVLGATGYPTSYDRLSVVQSATGDIYSIAGLVANGSQGCAVYRHSASGILLGYAVVDGFAAQLYDPHLVKLASGNLAVTYSDGSNIRYAVLSPALGVVKAATTIEASYSSQQSSTVALAAGGFLLTWQQGGAPLNQRVAVYDNNGTVVTAPTTFKTWAGAAQTVHAQLAVLSNNEIAFAALSNITAAQGLWIGTLTATGAVSVAITQVAAAETPGYKPNLSVMAGYFMVSEYNAAAGLVARVFSNAGVQQGATYGPVAANTSGGNSHATANDGTNFYLTFCPASGSNFTLVRITTTGAATTYAIGGANTGYAHQFHAFSERGRLVVSYSNVSIGFKFFVFNTATLVAEATAQALGPGDGQYHAILPGGDFSIIYLGGDAGVKMGVTKYANTAVLGVAAAAAAASAQAPILSGAGAYGVNFLKGSASKAFDHTSGANICGNKGVVLNYGAVFKGMV